MEQGSRSTLPAGVNRLRARVERWRRQRTKRSPMPEDLWESAVSLARRHGVYPIARALGISYGTLKKRVARRPRLGQKTGKLSTQFIEMTPTPLLGGAELPGMVVELWDRDGAKLVVRLPEGEGVEVRRLAEAFWRRRG